MNHAEGFFSKVVGCVLMDRSFESIVEIRSKIKYFVKHENNNAKPKHWGKDADDLIATWKCGRYLLESNY